MKLKDKELGLFIVTLVKGLQKLYEAREIPDTIGTVYLKMITILVNHFVYSIKDLKSIEEFTEEEKSIIDLPVLGVFLDPDSLPEEDHFKDAITKARLMAMEQQMQEIRDNNQRIKS